MDRYPRLSRSQVIRALRAHAAVHGFVSNASLHAHDPIVLRSIPLYFVGIAAAREAARVMGAPKKKGAKTGPKAGTVAGRRVRTWSRQRVIEQLRQLDGAGQRTTLAALVQAGHGALVHAASQYAGGLRNARRLAGIATPSKARSSRSWTRATIVRAIRKRSRQRQPLAASRAPQRLVTAGRWHFGSWSAALTAAGVDPDTARLPPTNKYTKASIIARLRLLARAGSDLRALTLAKLMKLEAVRREFGTLRGAIVAAGLGERLLRRKHALQKWSRERVIEVLQERAADGVYTLTPGLHRVVQLYFGGADAARAAARVPSPLEARAMRRRGRRPQPRRRVDAQHRR